LRLGAHSKEPAGDIVPNILSFVTAAMNPGHPMRIRIARSIGFGRRFWLLIVVLGFLLGAVIDWPGIRSDWFLTHSDSVIVAVRRNFEETTSSADSRGFDYYKLTGTEKTAFVTQFRQRTHGLWRQIYAGYPCWVLTLDVKGRCSGRILLQGTKNGRREQWQAIIDAAVKGERVPKVPDGGEFLVRQVRK
jgi:hypothetical protein